MFLQGLVPLKATIFRSLGVTNSHESTQKIYDHLQLLSLLETCGNTICKKSSRGSMTEIWLMDSCRFGNEIYVSRQEPANEWWQLMNIVIQ